MLLLTQLIFGTGVGPFVNLEPVTCPGAAAALRFSYQVDWGVCAPGGPCSSHSESPDPNTDLVLRQEGCFWPEPVAFVPERCSGTAAWRVKGGHARSPLRLEPIQGGTGLSFQASSKAKAQCPGPPESLPSLGPSPIQASAHTRSQSPENFQIEAVGQDTVRLVSPSGVALDDSDGLYRSEPMSRARAEALLGMTHYDAYMRREMLSVTQKVLGGEQTLRLVPGGDQSWCVASRRVDLALELAEGTQLTLSGTDTRVVERVQCQALTY